VGDPLAVLAGATVPQAGEHEVPFWVSFQVTPPLLGSLATVAVNCCVVLSATLAEAGATDTEIGAVTVTVADIDFVGSDTEVAVTVTVRLLAGGVDGAV